MRPDPPEVLQSRDAIKTYRYLRIGMVGAVVLLAASIVIEYGKVDCLQTSISAYYYTPARAIFVGGMMAVGFALIMIKGRGTWEDTCLNFAGMLAPVVAIAPTTDVGDCWSVEPRPLPIEPDGQLANWVVTNVDNNFSALLIAGALGLSLAFILTIVLNRSLRAPIERVQKGTWISLAVTAAAIVVAWWLIESWGDFYQRAHGFAALLMFVFLIGAVIGKALQNRAQGSAYFPIYSALAVIMPLGGVAIAFLRIGDRHTVFVLEAFEIVLFAVFWVFQTVESWDERVSPSPGPGGGAGAVGV